MPALLASLATLAGASGCSGGDHPPVIEDTPRGGSTASGGQGAQSSGASDSGASDSGGASDGGASGSVEPIAEGLFDPDQVYIAALIKGSDKWAVAPVEDPSKVVVGLDMRSVVGLWGTHLIYQQTPSRPVQRLSAEVVNPDTLEGLALPASLRDDDPIMETAPCRGALKPQYSGPTDFMVAPAGRLVYRCGDSRIWYESGKVLVELPEKLEVLLFGNDDLMLVKYIGPNNVDEFLGVMRFGDAEPVEVGSYFPPVVARANPEGGFLIAHEGGLAHLDASGQFADVGTYEFGCGDAMAGDGTCYSLARADDITTVLRNNLDGVSEEIYVPEPGMILDGITTSSAPNAFIFGGP